MRIQVDSLQHELYCICIKGRSLRLLRNKQTKRKWNTTLFIRFIFFEEDYGAKITTCNIHYYDIGLIQYEATSYEIVIYEEPSLVII